MVYGILQTFGFLHGFLIGWEKKLDSRDALISILL